MYAHLKHSRTHTSHCVPRQEWRNTDCVVVTMALVSEFSHPESIILLKALLVDSVHGKSLLVGTVSEASCYLHHSFTTSSPSRQVVTPLSLHSSQSSPSPPWLARCLSFRLVLSESVAPSVSAISSAILTYALLSRCPVQNLVL